MKWVETHGRKPKTGERLLLIKFRNGLESKKAYSTDQLRWSHIGDPWDIMEVARG